MKLSKWLGMYSGVVNALIKSLSKVANVVVAIMVLVVAINVFGRYLFHQPLLGTFELVELMMVVIGFISIAYTAVYREHVSVDLVISHLSRRAQAIMNSISFFLSLAIFVVITYQATVFAIYYAHDLNKATYILSVPLVIPRSVMVLGCLLLCLRLLVDVFRPLPPEESHKGS